MKRFTILLILLVYANYIISQNLPYNVVNRIRSQFESRWEYFRMLKDPTIPNEVKYKSNGGWMVPNLLPDVFVHNYIPIIKITPLPYGSYGNTTVSFNGDFYIIEKGDGLTGRNTRPWDKTLTDTMHVDVNNSLFPYDNLFLVYYSSREDKCYFLAGNVMWADYREFKISKYVDFYGYLRGVQFGVRNVFIFDPKFSSAIREARPEYPDYEYTKANESLLKFGPLLIGAPKGREDELIEFIYYSDFPEKTGDEQGVFYEMRYIVPTNIESITERRMEKRKMSEEETARVFAPDSPLRFYIDMIHPRDFVKEKYRRLEEEKKEREKVEKNE
ncbi:hypothetical protein [Dysgonomonas sp. 520]|uniref:hypothetical protein n=1 Tax=Dysgonomonas sp. 520 TaxID=2302931 RepID=UPI0013D06035|nr:hypothetical protein [Dysgonomonas sp. 520]NDW11058.1 hypothetical protein [Dysgonomonas sp. 520]